jgi:phosphoinositide-3-kinase, regulatory subunit 4
MFQSFHDPELLVVERVLGSLSSLTELGFFRKMKLKEILQLASPIANHPSKRLRKGKLLT